jgi:hypothetical protein
MRLWINIEVHRVASFAIGRACHKFRAISHHNVDGVVVGMDIGFHNLKLLKQVHFSDGAVYRIKQWAAQGLLHLRSNVQ